MRCIENPEFPVLRGEEAIWALFNFVHELEEQRDKELTDKHLTALIKFAKGLISSIGEEMRSSASEREITFAPPQKNMKYTPECLKSL